MERENQQESPPTDKNEEISVQNAGKGYIPPEQLAQVTLAKTSRWIVSLRANDGRLSNGERSPYF